ncbi:hypothetical protein Agub_g6231, partial [Astrephomene gubernaculifera]
TQAAGVASNTLPAYPDGTDGRGATGSTPTTTGPKTTASASRENVLQRKVAELEQKMAMSRSIMKKLYHKNVELEKELAIAKANSGGLDLTSPPATAAASRPGTSLRPPATAPASSGMAAADAGLTWQALQERDLTIRQLQQALEASRRRCALLEMQLASGNTAGGGGGAAVNSGGGTGGGGRGSSSSMGPGAAGGGGGGGRGGVSADSLRDLVAQSALHHQKYKQIREDYNRLLYKRASALQVGSRSTSANALAARALVGELQRRLEAEVQEREAEAALYSARLYESEKAMSDWYVEKRLLQEHIARLSGEVAERDKIDGEIEGCVAAMLERLRLVEAENEALRSRL